MYEAGDEVFRKKFEDLQRMGQCLGKIDRHDALFLLRHCFAIPKVTYFLRTAPFFKHSNILTLYDNEWRNILQTVLNVDLQDKAWSQCTLPL